MFSHCEQPTKYIWSLLFRLCFGNFHHLHADTPMSWLHRSDSFDRPHLSVFCRMWNNTRVVIPETVAWLSVAPQLFWRVLLSQGQGPAGTSGWLVVSHAIWMCITGGNSGTVRVFFLSFLAAFFPKCRNSCHLRCFSRQGRCSKFSTEGRRGVRITDEQEQKDLSYR